MPDRSSSGPPRWGLADAAVVLFIAFGLSNLIGGSVLSAAGWRSIDDVPIWALALLQIPLWLGLGGGTLVVSRVRGAGSLRTDFGLRFLPLDVPVGLVIGVAAQYFVSYVVTWPVIRLSGSSFDDYEEPARKLADKADASGWWGIVLLVLVVVVAAPLIEELFYRGLLFRSFLRRWPPAASVVITGLLFGASHFEPLQLPALAAFGAILGVLAWRTGRLGPSIFVHVGFNATTVVVLLVDKAHG